MGPTADSSSRCGLPNVMSWEYLPNIPSATSTKHWHLIVSAQVSSSLTSEPCFPTELDSFILGYVTYWLKNKTGSLHIVIFIWLTLTHISWEGQSLLKSISNNVLVISLHLVSSEDFKVVKYSSLSSSNNRLKKYYNNWLMYKISNLVFIKELGDWD